MAVGELWPTYYGIFDGACIADVRVYLRNSERWRAASPAEIDRVSLFNFGPPDPLLPIYLISVR